MDDALNSLSDRYLDERFRRIEDRTSALKELFEQRATTGDEALRVAKAGLNEMRGMALDQQNAFLTKAEYNAKNDDLVRQIANVQEKVTALIGRDAGVGKMWYVMATIAALLVATASFFLKHTN
jgi:hypothetical protein